jgi:hypothetical protein
VGRYPASSALSACYRLDRHCVLRALVPIDVTKTKTVASNPIPMYSHLLRATDRNMRNKPRVMLTIHYRDELSLGDRRLRLGYATYRWGILIRPKKRKSPDSTGYDVSNGANA